jgi:hypothetical protein
MARDLPLCETCGHTFQNGSMELRWSPAAMAPLTSAIFCSAHGPKEFTFAQPLTVRPYGDGVCWQILDWETGEARHLHEMG